MSTLTGVSSKGEKGKSKFQSLDINSIYNKTNKGESSEQLQTKSTVPRKHGMQSLGKVPFTRRAPVNLPSLKSEHSGSDPTVSLVPAGSTGWGSKTSDTAPPITSTSPVTTSGQTQSTNAPAVVGTAPVQPVNITPAPPLPPKPVVSTGGDKTWSSVMTGGESGSGPSFLAHQSPQFQAEFPSLPGEAGVPGLPARPGEGGYGPGPSLRPQTEGSWALGGAAPPPPPPAHVQVEPRPINQFPPPLPTIGAQFKSVVPAFMLNRSAPGNGGFPGMFPNNFTSTTARPKFSTPTDNSSRSTSIPDSEDLMSRPIIREEDLNRMDEISRDSGWATQDDIDYNQKLAFSDDESGGNDDEKGFKGKSMYTVQSREEKKDKETEKENRDKTSLNEKLPDKGNQPWQVRSQTISTPEFRGPLTTRLSHSNTTREMDVEEVDWKDKRRQQSNTTRELEMDEVIWKDKRRHQSSTAREMDVEEVVWKEKRRQQSEQIAVATEKAKQRKEEEEKRFEETRSKTENEKKKKEAIESDVEERKDSADNFRKMTQLESRSFPRNELYSSRFLSTIPPRFQKQNSMRQQQQNASDSRWNSSLYSNSKQRTRKDSEEGKEKDDEKDRRERNTPEFSESRKEREKEGETTEWEVRRGNCNSPWEGMRNLEDSNKPTMRRDNKKPIDNFNKTHASAFDDRDGEWRERQEIRERPVRPDSRDSRTSRESRTSRDDCRSIQDNVTTDYSWGDTEYDKEIPEEKPRRKETYKEDSFKDRREPQAPHTRREGHVPGPITREKMEAYEHKQHMAEVIKAEKKELINSSLDNRHEDDTWKKVDSTNNTVSWADSSEECSLEQKQGQSALVQTHNQNSSPQSQPSQKLIVPQSRTPDISIAHPPASNNLTDEGGIDKLVKDDTSSDKKKDMSLNVGMPINMGKDNKGQGGRGSGRNSRGGGLRQNNYSGTFSVYYRHARPNKDGGSRRGSSKVGKPWNASESDASGDEVSVSTESGKEDKKSERKQVPRSPKMGERKKDKDRIREPKKNELFDKSNSGGLTVRKPVQLHQQPLGSQLTSNTVAQMAVSSQNQQNTQQQNSFENNSSGSRKEGGGFLPRGEPSRRGRGGFRTGGRGPFAAHYGPPGSKPAFPTPLTTNKEDEDNDSSSEEKKRPLITGRKDQRKSDSDSSRSNKGKPIKIKREQDDCETTSEGSDSEAKGKLPRQNKKPVPRSVGSSGLDKRNIFNAGQMNGRPRSEDGKPEKNRLNKEEDESSRFTHETFYPNNGFQEVRSKKTGKDNRTVGKDDLKRGRGKEKGNKGLQGGSNSKGPQNKSFQREWNNKPPRMQRMAFLQQQQNQSDPVSDMNKINQNISMFPIRDVNCSTAPAPPPPVNAWDKPITASLRTTSPAPNLHLAPTAAIPNTQEKNTIEINDHGPSGTSSQTNSPSTEKALSKIGREAVEKSFLDGATPPVQTIVFENTNLKTPSEIALKSKFPSKRIDKCRDRKLDEELDDGSHMSLGNFKPGSEIKPGENKNQESIQMPMSFSKNEDNADMKLDFPFDQDLSHLTDDKTNIRPMHPVLGQNSAADLNQKIASVKKVWDRDTMDHPHPDEVVSTSSFTQNFGSAVDSSLDQSSTHQVDDTTFTSDVYATPNPSNNRTSYYIITSGSQLQGSGPTGYASAGPNIIKQDPSNPSSNVCKVKPQPQQPVISPGIGTHSGQSLSSPSPPFTQQGHYSYQTQYNTAAISAIPSPPVHINSGPAAVAAQQVPPSHQAELYPFPVSGTAVLSGQQPRSGFSQYPPYGLSQGLGSSSPFNQQSIYLPQAAAPPPNTADVFQSLSQYRIQPSAAAYGQSPQLSNSPSTVLITSSSNSLMSASVKSSPQPPLGAIGSKAAYQSSAHPTQLPLSYIQYEQIMTPNLFQNSHSQIVQRHGGNSVVPTMSPSNSYYSSSAGVGGQAGLYQPASSLLAGGTGSQPASLHNATAFGMQGFSAQSAVGQGQPASNNQVPSFSSQMGHFRAPAPTAPYLKAGNNAVPGQHSDPSKSPSTTQDGGYNSVFSPGGSGQISSPKSRSGSNNNSAGKQVQSSQQPSPTQAQPHHKFQPYQTQQNLAMPGGGSGGNQHVQSSGGRGPPISQGSGSGVRSGSNNGLGGNGLCRYPAPIQRPVVYGGGSMQQQRHRAPQQSRPQPHMKIPGSYYPHQGNSVKLDVATKDTDKLQESNSPTNKTDKKEEQVNSSDQ